MTTIEHVDSATGPVPAVRSAPERADLKIDATGTTVTVKALYELRRTGGHDALVRTRIGGGQGIATIFQRLRSDS